MGQFTLAVASGKGGTGKTLVATGLAVIAADVGRSVTLVDCDVEAPNDHLFLSRRDTSVAPVTVPIAEADPAACNACGICRDACAYGAIRILGGAATVFGELCHGCGLCASLCSTGAMREVEVSVGEVEQGTSVRNRRLNIVTGRLHVGPVTTPAVIRAARAAASTHPADLTFLDAPPGVSCAAVAAVRGADAMLLVTEPTRFGLHDLELSLRLGRDLGLPIAIVVNRDGVGSADIRSLAEERSVPIVARIPFDRRVAEVYASGATVSDLVPEVAAGLSDVLSWVGSSAEVASL